MEWNGMELRTPSFDAISLEQSSHHSMVTREIVTRETIVAEPHEPPSFVRRAMPHRSSHSNWL